MSAATDRWREVRGRRKVYLAPESEVEDAADTLAAILDRLERVAMKRTGAMYANETDPEACIPWFEVLRIIREGK